MLPSATYHQKTNDLLSLGGSSTFPLKDVNLPVRMELDAAWTACLTSSAALYTCTLHGAGTRQLMMTGLPLATQGLQARLTHCNVSAKVLITSRLQHCVGNHRHVRVVSRQIIVTTV